MALVTAGMGELDHSALQLVLRTHQHVVVYDPVSQNVMVRNRDASDVLWDEGAAQSQESAAPGHSYACPMCQRPWGAEQASYSYPASPSQDASYQIAQGAGEPVQMAPHYFRLLSESGRPPLAHGQPHALPNLSRQSTDATNQGYYARFFVELGRLGRGARGIVYLCQHMLSGHALGQYAVKKIPVGDYR